MANNLGLTVKPVCEITPEEEGRVARLDQHAGVPGEELRAAGAGRSTRPTPASRSAPSCARARLRGDAAVRARVAGLRVVLPLDAEPPLPRARAGRLRAR